jgi:hypothetical protein
MELHDRPGDYKSLRTVEFPRSPAVPVLDLHAEHATTGPTRRESHCIGKYGGLSTATAGSTAKSTAACAAPAS